MHGMNFSLKRLLLVVLFAALGLAALQANSHYVDGLVFTIALGLLCLSIVGAATRGGADRVYWLGFAVFGWVYAFTALGLGGPQSSLRWYSRPELITTQLLDLYAQLRLPYYKVGSHVVAQWRSGTYYPGVIREAKDGQYLVAWDDGDTPLYVFPNQIQGNSESYQRVGHSLFCPLVGWLGAVFAVWMFAERKPAQTPQPPEEPVVSSAETASIDGPEPPVPVPQPQSSNGHPAPS